MSASRKAAPPAATHTITELAQEFDITPRAIRFYEDVGLLTPGRDGRNRVYTHRDRTRLKLTLRGKRLGLTLQEIKQLVDMYESPDDTAAGPPPAARTTAGRLGGDPGRDRATRSSLPRPAVHGRKPQRAPHPAPAPAQQSGRRGLKTTRYPCVELTFT
jgi:DNA-binding transcriptional MerR regulator